MSEIDQFLQRLDDLLTFLGIVFGGFIIGFFLIIWRVLSKPLRLKPRLLRKLGYSLAFVNETKRFFLNIPSKNAV